MTVNLMDDGSIATISVLYSLFEASDVKPGIDALKLLADISEQVHHEIDVSELI